MCNIIIDNSCIIYILQLKQFNILIIIHFLNILMNQYKSLFKC